MSLPTTMIRAVVDGVLGSVTEAVPELGTAVASVVGNVSPPSVESRISTFAQLMSLAVVPATFQVTEVVPERVTAVFGAVTAKAAPVFTTVSVTVLL